MTTESLFLLLFVAIGSGCMAGFVANEKGYSYTTWFYAGLFFSLFAIVAVAGLPDRRDEALEREQRRLKAAERESDLRNAEFRSTLPPLE